MNAMELSRRNFVKLFGGASMATVLGLAGCGGSGGSGSAEAATATKGGTLNVGFAANPVSFNVWVQNDITTSIIMGMVCPNLVVMNDEGVKENYLIEESSSNDDATEWTVTFKELYWNDGEPLTADDIAFTCMYGLEHKIGFFDSFYHGVTSAEVVDERTVKYTLEAPYVNFPNGWGFWIPMMRKSEWENEADPMNHTYSNAGYGPFYIDEWVDGQYVSLKRNEYFTQANDGEGAWVDEVMCHVYTDENAMVLALQNGEIDVCGTYISANSKSQLETDSANVLTDIESLGYGQISFSQKVPLLTDVNMRTAIAMCVDREAMCAVGMNGAAEPMMCPVSPVYPQFIEEDIQQPAFDTAGAKQLLLDNGYTEGSDGILVAPDGTRASFEVIYKNSIQNVDSVMEIFRSSAEEAGIELDLQSVDAATYTGRVNGSHEFDISYNVWGSIDDVDSSLYTTYGIGQTLNFMDYNNEEMDGLLLEMRSEPDADRRKELLNEWQRMFVEELPVVQTYVPVQTYAAKNAGFTGYGATYGNHGYLETKYLCGVHQVEA